MKEKNGAFFAFDGPNCSGKSSLVRKVAQILSGKEIAVVATKEPTNSELGNFIRSAEAEYKGLPLAYLVAADRLWHIEHEIRPAIAGGNVVLTDRFITSSLALQSLDGISMDLIWSLHPNCPAPAVTFIVSAPTEILAQRLKGRSSLSRFEKTVTREDEVKAYRVASEFLRGKSYNVKDVENTESLDAIASHVANIIVDHLAP